MAGRDDDQAGISAGCGLQLPGLSQSASAALLAERAADLAPHLRDRLIEEATGIPLALIELAIALRAGDPISGAPTVTAALSIAAAGCWMCSACRSIGCRSPPGGPLVAAAEDTGELGVFGRTGQDWVRARMTLPLPSAHGWSG